MWEHLVIEISGCSLTDVQKKLDDASSNVWELVSTNYDSDSWTFYLFFKRPTKSLVG